MSTDVYRVSKRKHSATAFSGEGGRLSSGRWNSKGTPIVYTSATLSLAALETFVSLEIEDAGTLFVAIGVDIPDEVEIKLLQGGNLPRGWNAIPAPEALSSIGDRWFNLRETAVLAVPSAIIPAEYNYLLNPLHPDFPKITIYSPAPFSIDSRLWRPRR
ncbi:MAG: RES family NAD+ phosphorylase [Gemmatimonadaceae bacterium]|nr:RES family NAD+ phosphorylase [Gloeobacterales cyanobacterium ES-bin-141]